MISDRLIKRLWHYISLKISNIEDREDVLQETILCYLLKSKQIKQNHEAYIFGICKNKVIDYYKRRKKESKLFDNSEVIDNCNEIFFDDNLLKCLNRYDLMLIKERFYNNKSLKEIALNYNKNYATIRWQIRQILKKLKIIISKGE